MQATDDDGQAMNAAASAQVAPARPGYWWERALGENAWMEITRRDDMGEDLKAPSAARGGVTTASYALVLQRDFAILVRGGAGDGAATA